MLLYSLLFLFVFLIPLFIYPPWLSLWYIDQGRDARVVEAVMQTGILPVLGPQAGGTGFLGPATYFILSAISFFGLKPWQWYWAFWGLQCLSLFLLSVSIVRVGFPLWGVIAVALISIDPFLQFFWYTPTNPNLLPILAVLLLALFLKKKKSDSVLMWVVSGCVWALACQLHLSAITWAGFFAGALLAMPRDRWRPSGLALVGAFIVFSIVFMGGVSPMLAFVTAVKSGVNVVGQPLPYASSTVERLFHWVAMPMTFFKEWSRLGIWSPFLVYGGILYYGLLAGLSGWALFQKTPKGAPSSLRTVLWGAKGWLLMMWVAFPFVSQKLSFYYVLGAFPVVYLLSAWVLSRNKWVAMAMLPLFLVMIVMTHQLSLWVEEWGVVPVPKGAVWNLPETYWVGTIRSNLAILQEAERQGMGRNCPPSIVQGVRWQKALEDGAYLFERHLPKVTECPSEKIFTN